MFLLYSGLSAETVGLNDKGNPLRDDVAAGGGVRVDGVLADGIYKKISSGNRRIKNKGR